MEPWWRYELFFLFGPEPPSRDPWMSCFVNLIQTRLFPSLGYWKGIFRLYSQTAEGGRLQWFQSGSSWFKAISFSPLYSIGWSEEDQTHKVRRKEKRQEKMTGTLLCYSLWAKATGRRGRNKGRCYQNKVLFYEMIKVVAFFCVFELQLDGNLEAASKQHWQKPNQYF